MFTRERALYEHLRVFVARSSLPGDPETGQLWSWSVDTQGTCLLGMAVPPRLGKDPGEGGGGEGRLEVGKLWAVHEQEPRIRSLEPGRELAAPPTETPVSAAHLPPPWHPAKGLVRTAALTSTHA